jgi:hypothetical protein
MATQPNVISRIPWNLDTPGTLDTPLPAVEENVAEVGGIPPKNSDYDEVMEAWAAFDRLEPSPCRGHGLGLN